MLQRLFVKNVALIEELDVDFTAGFNVLTGETGAGKSIVIDAVPQAAVAAGLSRTACRSRDTGGRAGPDGDGTGAGSAPGAAVGAAVFKG